MVTIVLPPDLEKSITERALQNGTTPELIALEALQHEFAPEAAQVSTVGTLADFLGDFIGCLDSGEVVPGGARMSEQIGEKFAAGVAEKHAAHKR